MKYKTVRTARTRRPYLAGYEGREGVVVAENVLFGVALVPRHRVVFVQDGHHPVRDDGFHRRRQVLLPRLVREVVRGHLENEGFAIEARASC